MATELRKPIRRFIDGVWVTIDTKGRVTLRGFRRRHSVRVTLSQIAFIGLQGNASLSREEWAKPLDVIRGKKKAAWNFQEPVNERQAELV